MPVRRMTLSGRRRNYVGSATIVGHGMGCLVAEAMARITPGLVEKLVLIEPRVEVAGETRERRVERMHAQNVPLPGLLETLFRIQREWLMSSKLWAKFLVFVQNRAKKTPLKTLDPRKSAPDEHDLQSRLHFA